MLEQILNKHKIQKKSTSTNQHNEEKGGGLFLNEEQCLDQKSKVDEVMKKYCTLYNDNQEKYSIKPMNHDFLQQKQRKSEKEKTAGKAWFDLPAPELTPELRNDLKAIQLRSVIDPSRFYKKLDRKKLPKYFQIGTIQDNIIDGKDSRLKKSEVKDRLYEEFLEEDKRVNFSKRKFDEIQSEKRKISMKKQKVNKYKLQTRGKKRKTDFIVKN